MEQVEGCYGCRMLARRAADAPATIAALQARVQELESNRVPNSMQHVIELQAMNNRLGVRVETLESQLTQRTAERDTARRRVDELEAREVDVALLRGDLEKRTAELETVTRERDEAAKDRDDWITSWRALQRHNERIEAELERVRGELAETKEEVKCLDEQVSALNQGCLEYELLLKALPRMEGDVEVYHHESGLRHSVVARPANKYYSSFDTPEEAGAYAAILKHRQGMEG